MDIGGSLKAFVAGSVWRTAGTRWAGTTLLDEFAHGDEQTRALAGMFLVKAGDRTVELIGDEVRAGSAGANAVGLIGDVGTPSARAELVRLSEGEGEIAAAAQASLEILDPGDI